MRYVYSKFDFTTVKNPGLYVIEYAGQRTAPLSHLQGCLRETSGRTAWIHHLAVQMDHVSVREAYRVWHGASHLDDGRMAPVVGGAIRQLESGGRRGMASNKGGDHIPGMNVGG